MFLKIIKAAKQGLKIEDFYSLGPIKPRRLLRRGRRRRQRSEGYKNLRFLNAAWYRKAAEQGNAGAQFYLGSCYDQGRGVDKDPKAIKIFDF